MASHVSLPSLRRTTGAAALLLVSAVTALAQDAPQAIRLPEARRQGEMSLEAALWARRSIRDLKPDAVPLADAAQLLWAAQGKNRPDGHRTAPSARAVYPLEVYLVAGAVDGLAAGVYRYRSATHDLVLAQAGDRRAELASAPGRPSRAAEAPLIVVYVMSGERARRLGALAERFSAMEVGFAAQNLYLQAASLGLGTTFMAGFNDSAMTRVLAAGERALGIMPVGQPR